MNSRFSLIISNFLCLYFHTFAVGCRVANKNDQVLKIRRSDDSGPAIFALSGRIEENDIPKLQELLNAEAEIATTTLDLQEVRLVDRAAVRFLAASEAQGIKLRCCPPYIREWIETGSDISHER